MSKIYALTPFPRLLVKKNVAIYARISSPRKEQVKSLDNQLGGLVSYVNNEPLYKLIGVYTDIGSGRSADGRAELKRLLQTCKDGKVDLIVTKSISRFGRNTVDLLSICRRLTEKGIDVYFYNEGIHSLSPDGELSMTLASAIAEGESHNKSENIKWGIKKRAKDTDSAIYSRTCYGYKHDEYGNLKIVKEEAEVVRRIFESYTNGKGSYAIKKMLEADQIPSPTGKEQWSKRTIEKILINEKYYGDVIIYKTYMGDYPDGKRIVNDGSHVQYRCEDQHRPIITKERFDEVQRLIAERGEKR